jgi:hypothetical protein
MSKTLCYCLLATAGMASPLTLSAQDIQLRAGTLLQCTIVEPNFSSHTAQISEPLICHARPFREFGREAFPRESYLTRQLVGYRDPGHFVGNGWMKLEFDRLILAHSGISVSTNVQSVGRFNLDAEGRTHGHGHPTRDALGWTIPLLWPVKLVALPQRGPRPTLKGELRVTLRLLGDVDIPGDAFPSSAALRNTQRGESNQLQTQSGNGFPKSQTVCHSFRRPEDPY